MLFKKTKPEKTHIPFEATIKSLFTLKIGG